MIEYGSKWCFKADKTHILMAGMGYVQHSHQTYFLGGKLYKETTIRKYFEEVKEPEVVKRRKSKEEPEEFVPVVG